MDGFEVRDEHLGLIFDWPGSRTINIRKLTLVRRSTSVALAIAATTRGQLRRRHCGLLTRFGKSWLATIPSRNCAVPKMS